MADEQAPGADDEKTISFKQYQQLQREHEKSRKRNAELLTRVLEQSELMGAVARIDEALPVLLEVLGKSGTLDEADDLSKTAGTHKQARERDKAVAPHRREITRLLAEADTDWSDPRLEKARPVWESGDVARAAEMVREAFKPGGTDQSLADIVAAEVQKHIQGKTVDTGDAAAVAAAGIPSDMATLQSRIKEDRSWWLANKVKILQMVRQGQIK